MASRAKRGRRGDDDGDDDDDGATDDARLPVQRCPFGHGTVRRRDATKNRVEIIIARAFHTTVSAAIDDDLAMIDARTQVSVDPYPGYVHGKHPAVCPRGCEPLEAAKTKRESAGNKLRREAEEYARLYGHERGIDEKITDARVKHILDSIDTTGTYAHTLDEIRWGARIAWRNAPKCINRKFWATLDVIDARDAETNDEMFEAIKEHLRRGIGGDHIPVLMTVFKPQTPNTEDGPRVWNSQLIRYAGHRGPNETTIGDPAELHFTDSVKKYFDWVPKGGAETPFDPLPIVVQISPSTPPSIYELPDECLLEVPIHHPTIPGISQLGLRWYGIPAVSNITLDLGGLHYTAAPFNGWYMVTEIATRNFCDESRYNFAPRIAKAMGTDTSTNETLWKDHALAAINYAVLYSFKRARVSIADHHTCAESFAQWYADEMKDRGYAPGNWKWIVPPTAASTSSIYLGLNKMTEYTLKPALVGGMSLNQLVIRARRANFFTASGLSQAAMHVAVAAAKWRKRMVRVKGALILYASDGGRTQARASWLWLFLRQRFPMIRPINVANPDLRSDDLLKALERVEFVIVLASTTGSGAVPTGSERFIEWCRSDGAREALKDKNFALCAFGSRAYPKFCGGGKQFAMALREADAKEMFPMVCADQLEGEDASVHEFTKSLFNWFHKHERITASLRDLLTNQLVSGARLQPSFALNVRRRDVHGRDHTADHRAGVPATLTDRVVLGDGSRLNTVAVTLTLPRGHRDTEFYKPGDHVSVYPRTSEARARYFVAHFGIDFDDQIELVPLDESEIFENSLDSSIPNPVGAGYLFTTVLDINKEPSAELLQALAHYVDDETCKAQMENLALDEDARREWISQTGARISTLFDQFPTLSATHRRDKAVGIEMLRDILLKIPKLRARYYSVSSSPRAVGNNVFSLTVGRVTYRNGDGVNSHMHLGFCSDFLATLPLRTNVMVEMLPAPAFRLPRSPKVPILMIAGGTGIAPFKGFVDHRACMAPEQRSDAWLIVGCRTRGNQLYRDEMEIAAENGALTAYLVGYSREPDLPKMYVDAVMRENGAGIRDLIKGGGHVYVCGDVRIETSVRGALDDILGRAEVESLEKSGRYHLDIFGAFDVQTSLNQQLKSARRSLSCRNK